MWPFKKKPKVKKENPYEKAGIPKELWPDDFKIPNYGDNGKSALLGFCVLVVTGIIWHFFLGPYMEVNFPGIMGFFHTLESWLPL